MVPKPPFTVSLFLQLAFLLCVLSMVHARNYTIVNKCPTRMKLIVKKGSLMQPGDDFSSIASGGDDVLDLGVDDGFASITVVPTLSDDKGVSATRAGFYQDKNRFNYFIERDWGKFGAGIRITPNHEEANGTCETVTCDTVSCTSAVDGPPLDIASSHSAPKPPIHSCPFPDLSYTITFCPNGKPPGDTELATAFHWNPNTSHPDKCLDVRGGVFANGTAVQIYDCNETGAQKWVSSHDFTRLRVANTNFCLDAGNEPTNGSGLKIRTCDKLFLGGQQWYSGGSSIRTFGKQNTDTTVQNYCVDLADGVFTNGNQIQIWECSSSVKVLPHENQLWIRGP